MGKAAWAARPEIKEANNQLGTKPLQDFPVSDKLSKKRGYNKFETTGTHNKEMVKSKYFRFWLDQFFKRFLS